jgi:carboxyl-terminal processing protease
VSNCLRFPVLLKPFIVLCVIWICTDGCALVHTRFAVGLSGGSDAVVWAATVGNPVSRDEAIRHSTASRLELISSVVALLQKSFVRPICLPEVLQAALDRLTLTLLPTCTESIEPLKDCRDGLSECFAQAINTIAETCQMDPDRLCQVALKELLHGLDPYATLLNRTMLKELNISVSGRFGGVGMVVDIRDGDYVVIAPFDGSPAYKAGIRAGDKILAIDGRSLHGLPLTDVLGMVRGPAGSTVLFTVKDSETGKIERRRVRRRTIRIAPVRYALLSPRIGFMRIMNFQKGTAAQVKKALSRMLDHGRGGIRGLILDLRDNPGGLLDEAILTADLFVPSGVITSVKGRDEHSERKILASPGRSFPQAPMVVLINKGSASGSEVLAGALQGRPNVLVLGERSFGKASVQAVFPLGNNFALRLTTAHYYTADGRNIDGKGLEPDVKVPSPEVMPEQKLGFSKPDELERDPAIERALRYFEPGAPPIKSPFSTWF